MQIVLSKNSWHRPSSPSSEGAIQKYIGFEKWNKDRVLKNRCDDCKGELSLIYFRSTDGYDYLMSVLDAKSSEND